MIQALTRNITSDPTLESTTLLAIRAFYQALPYASPNFQVVHERDYIMERLFDAFKNPEQEIRVIAMQTLVDVGRQEYESVEFYFTKICEVTASSAKNDDEKVGA